MVRIIFILNHKINWNTPSGEHHDPISFLLHRRLLFSPHSHYYLLSASASAAIKFPSSAFSLSSRTVSVFSFQCRKIARGVNRGRLNGWKGVEWGRKRRLQTEWMQMKLNKGETKGYHVSLDKSESCAMEREEREDITICRVIRKQ